MATPMITGGAMASSQPLSGTTTSTANCWMCSSCRRNSTTSLPARRRLNRLVLGHGVVCGLNVVADTEGMVRIQPGVALDALGREIIVPEACRVNPHQLTDDQGSATGEPLETGTVEICLAYAEKKTDLVPVLVPDCDTPGNCAPSTIREGFYVIVRLAEGDAPAPPSCQLGDFPLPAPTTP